MSVFSQVQPLVGLESLYNPARLIGIGCAVFGLIYFLILPFLRLLLDSTPRIEVLVEQGESLKPSNCSL